MKNSNETNEWDSSKYSKHASFVSALALPVVDLLDPKEGEKILDAGCGDGTLALEIAKSGARVECIDASEDMVKKAKESGLSAKVMSVTNMPYIEEFDAVFSNAMLHWVRDSKEAVDNIAKALKPNGRFVAEFGGFGNVANIVEAMKQSFNNHMEFGEYDDFWYFPTPRQYKELLKSCGFRVDYIELIPRPTPIDNISNWLEVFTNGLTKNLTKEQIDIFRAEVKESLKGTNYSQNDGWVADYVRLRVKAVKVV